MKVRINILNQRTLGWPVVSALLFALLAHQWFGPDIWYHLFLGREVLSSGQIQPPDRLLMGQRGFSNFYWIFQLLIHGVYRIASVAGVSFLFALAWVLIGVIWLRTTSAIRAGWVGLFTVLCALLILSLRFEPRPEVFSYLFLSAEIYALVSWGWGTPDRSWVRVSAFAIGQAIWSGFHGYFALGPALVLARLGASVFERNTQAARQLAILFVVTLGATLVTPLGLDGWRGVLVLGEFFGEMKNEIQEFQSPGTFIQLWNVKLFYGLWILTGVGALWAAFSQKRIHFFAVALAGMGMVLSAHSFRNIPLLILLSAPLARICLLRLDTIKTLRWDKAGSAGIALVSIALTVAVIRGTFYESLASHSGFGIGLSEQAYPIQLAEFLRETAFRGKIFNNSDYGGYLEYHLPEVVLYGDSRFVNADQVRTYFRALKDPVEFQRLDQLHRFDAVLISVVQNAGLAKHLYTHSDWRLVFADLYRAFFVRADSVAGTSAPKLEFATAQDLTRRVHGRSAIQWVMLATELRDRGLLLAILEQLATSSRVPSFVPEFALRYGLQTGDREIVARALVFKDRYVALTSEDARILNELIRAAQ